MIKGGRVVCCSVVYFSSVVFFLLASTHSQNSIQKPVSSRCSSSSFRQPCTGKNPWLHISLQNSSSPTTYLKVSNNRSISPPKKKQTPNNQHQTEPNWPTSSWVIEPTHKQTSYIIVKLDHFSPKVFSGQKFPLEIFEVSPPLTTLYNTLKGRPIQDRSGPGHPLHPSTLLLQFQALPRLKHSLRRSARLRGTDLLVVRSSHEAAAHLHHAPPERRLKMGSLYCWMEEIRSWYISRYLQDSIHPRWCRISSINSITDPNKCTF